MKAAILQNSIGIGGRSKVIAEAITVLKSVFKAVDIHTLSNEPDQSQFLNHYQLDKDNLNITRYFGGRVPGTIYQQPLLNFFAKSKLSNYDLVFNSNNCVKFLPTDVDYIHYIHFPGQAIPYVDPKYGRWPYQVMSLPFQGLSSLINSEASGKVFTNSIYTLKYVKRSYHDTNAQVLYPPSLSSIQFSEYSGHGVVSLGSFHPNKRQLFQLKIARSFPDTTFRIIGSKSSEKYFEKCEEYINKYNMDNVELYPDASNSRVENLLNQSRVFLHSMENEKFGIATVEGINHGCVPVVHDSGGQKEIVPDPEFRFDTQQECVCAIDNALSGNTPDISDIPSHLAQYTEKRFRERLRKTILDMY